KLNRRQKAYDSIRSELDPATRTKIESAVLNRDYTSSDEEDTSTAGDGVDQQTADEQSQPLRVRELIWESEELRQLKNRLDSVAAASAPVVRRQSGVYSDRPAPVYDGLDWARKPAAAADNTTAGASSSGTTASSAPVLPFSALTLFESTLLNAGMLLDSMSMDELLGAMRLTANLHIQLIGAMQPCATDLQRKLNNLDSNNAPTTTDTTASNDNEQTINRHGNIGNENSDENSDSLSRGQLNSIPSLKRRLSTDREVCPVKLERHADADDDEELAEPPSMSPKPDLNSTADNTTANSSQWRNHRGDCSVKEAESTNPLNTIVIIDDDDDEDDDAGLVDEDCPTMTDAGPSSIPGSVVEMHKNRINVGGTAHMRSSRPAAGSPTYAREMKQRLDEAFTLRFATIKPAPCQLAKCGQDPEVVS
uniref:DDT domain-containing protein n=1 Tax=Macrostomum lignano TaxID=282301 RepID=A0A1I8FFW2_9PLAT